MEKYTLPSEFIDRPFSFSYSWVSVSHLFKMPNYKKVADCVRDLIIKGYKDGVFKTELPKTFDVNLFTVRSIIAR